jgi:anti-sigma regulatory factor (Ser/Thr protein kinase)
MAMKDSGRVLVGDTSRVAEARRLTATMGRALGFDETQVARASIVVTELGANLLSHAGAGEILFRSLQVGEASGLEVLALDQGPGIDHVGEALRDGYSTSGSPGTGLGAVERLSSVFDIYSRPGKGTAVLSQVWQERPTTSVPRHPLEVGIVCLPVTTEEACGDAWAVHQFRERTLVMVTDGLGHGEHAAQASTAAAKIFEECLDRTPAQIVECMHNALRWTRGVAVAIAELLWSQHLVRYAGVGNISGRLVSAEGVRGMVSQNGTAGLEARTIQEVSYPWPDDGLLILHSDGLAPRWDLEDYPGLRARHAALIGGVLFRDYNRIRDDTAVVVVRKSRYSP